MEPILRLGVIGLGQAGAMTVAAISQSSHFKLVAAADLNPASLAGFADDFQADTYLNAADVCHSKQVDAVYIATPTRLHKEHAVMALESGKHVLVEKPMAMTMADADAMISAAQRHGVTLMVNHKRSCDPPIRAIRRFVRDGSLGPLRMIHNWHYSDWLYRPRLGSELEDGGVVLRQGAHQFDMIRYMGGGLVRSVRASVGAWDPNRAAEGAYTAYLEFADGTVATSVYSGYDHFQFPELTDGIGVDGRQRSASFMASQHAAARKKLHAAGPAQELIVKQSGGYQSRRKKESTAATGDTYHSMFGITVASFEHGDIRQSPEGLYIYGDEERRELPLPKGETGLDAILAEFYAAVANGQRPIRDGAYGKACLEICQAVYQSARERREIYLQHQAPVQD